MRRASAASCFTPYGHNPLGKSLIGFNGELRDPLSGNYSLGNGYRTFSPLLMRFLCPDSHSPFGQGGLNAYAYCLGDPVNNVDRDGHAPKLLSNIAKTLKNIFTSGPTPVEQFSSTRKELHENVNQTTQWGKAVVAVNDALGSHGDLNIPKWKADSYIERSWSVTYRKNSHLPPPLNLDRKISRSESSLFFGSAMEWGHVGKDAIRSGSDEQLAAAIVGGALNAAGAFVAGAHDHSPYKTGKIFTFNPEELSHIRHA